MSKKRILPALILAGTVGFIGLHRFYAGRYVTGAVQLVMFAAGAVMLGKEFSGLFALQTVEQIQDWVLSDQNQVQLVPTLLAGVPVFWALWDCVVLGTRKFKDGAGNKIELWV